MGDWNVMTIAVSNVNGGTAQPDFQHSPFWKILICLWFLQEIYFGVRAKTQTSTPVLWSAHLTPAGHGNWHHVCPNPTRCRIEEGRHWHGCPARCKLPAFSADTQLMQRNWLGVGATGNCTYLKLPSALNAFFRVGIEMRGLRSGIWSLKLWRLDVGKRKTELLREFMALSPVVFLRVHGIGTIPAA